MTYHSFEKELLHWIAPIRFSPLRLQLRLPLSVEYQISTIRGVWGKALHLLDKNIYHMVFVGNGPANLVVPQYIIRQSRTNDSVPIKKGFAYPSLDFVSWGINEEQRQIALRAWDIASGMGLGPARTSFCISKNKPVFPYSAGCTDLSLADCMSENNNDSNLACEIIFDLPLRLIREKHFVNQPNPSILAEAILSRLAVIRRQCIDGWRRVDQVVHPSDIRPDFYYDLLESIDKIPYKQWQGNRFSMRRYSGRQKSDIDLDGVVGSLVFPQGTGNLYLLLKAAEQLHLGKTTTLGLGRPRFLFDSFSDQ